MISKEQIREWLKGRPIQYMNADCNHVRLEDLVHDCIQDLGLKWVSVEVIPACNHELTEWDDDCKNCLFDGFVSDTFIITDGMYTGHGHYRDDGCWTVYKGEHDFMNIDPSEITHYMKLVPSK